MSHSTTKMIFSIVILVLISGTASQEKEKPNSPTTQTSTDMTDPGDTSESQTTTQQIIIQTSVDVTNNTQTTTLQYTWLPQKSVPTMFESASPPSTQLKQHFQKKQTAQSQAQDSTEILYRLTQDQEPSKSSTTQTPTNMTHPGDTSESQTTTQQIIIQQTTTDVTNNTQTTTSQSTWLPQKSVLTTSESVITTVNSTETTFPEKPNGTVTDQGDRKEQDVAVNPGLVAVLCIFSIVVAVVVVVVIVKAVRSRSPQFEKLDDVPMGKINENAPFAHYPPK